MLHILKNVNGFDKIHKIGKVKNLKTISEKCPQIWKRFNNLKKALLF